MKHERTKINKVDLQRVLALRVAYELKSGWGISERTMEALIKLFPNMSEASQLKAIKI